jgi:hypothetical protein
MAKEFRTAEQLSDLIVSALGVSGLDIQVRKDHAYGWQPTVVSSPGDLIGYQRRVEEIANRFARSIRPAGMTRLRAPMTNERGREGDLHCGLKIEKAAGKYPAAHRAQN